MILIVLWNGHLARSCSLYFPVLYIFGWAGYPPHLYSSLNSATPIIFDN